MWRRVGTLPNAALGAWGYPIQREEGGRFELRPYAKTSSIFSISILGARLSVLAISPVRRVGPRRAHSGLSSGGSLTALPSFSGECRGLPQ
jgi:hypothetical protein